MILLSFLPKKTSVNFFSFCLKNENLYLPGFSRICSFIFEISFHLNSSIISSTFVLLCIKALTSTLKRDFSKAFCALSQRYNIVVRNFFRLNLQSTLSGSLCEVNCLSKKRILCAIYIYIKSKKMATLFDRPGTIEKSQTSTVSL